VAQFIFGPATQPFPTPVSHEPFHFGGTTITTWEIITLLVVVASIGGLTLFLQRTYFGTAVRAIAEDRRTAALLGIDVARTIVVTFCVASALGGLAGILGAALYNAVYPTIGSAAMLKAFAASVLGGMEVIGGAILGGLILGVTEAAGSVYISSAWRDAIALLVLVVVLLFKPTGLLGHRQLEKVERQSLNVLPLPALPRLSLRQPWLWIGLLAVIALPLVDSNSYHHRVLTVMLLYATLSLSLNVIAGFAGIISLGHAAFYGFGAYASALLATRFGLPFWVVFPAAAALTGLFGMAFAWPVMRLRGHYVAMGTLGLGGLVSVIILNWVDLTRGPMGIRAIPAPSLFGVELDGVGYYYLMLAILLVSAVVVVHVIDSAFGRALRAMRDDELGAASVGVSPRLLKMLAFGIAATIAGACGSFWAHFVTFISPDSFNTMESIGMLAMVVLGGLGSIPGAILGGAALAGLPELLRYVPGALDYRQAIYGLVMLCMVLFRPQGLLGFAPKRAQVKRATRTGVKTVTDEEEGEPERLTRVAGS
jgi:branched-chain amino acid transport system permease protein